MPANADLRILLVDDEPAMRELLRVTFESDDIAVEEAESGEEALAALRGKLPSAVVLDLRLPGIDGAEVCRRLRQRERTARLPIVVSERRRRDGARAREACRRERGRAQARSARSISSRSSSGSQVATDGCRPVLVPRRRREEELLLYARDLQHLIEVERAQRLLLTSSFSATVTALAGALESKDLGSARHSQRVRAYAMSSARGDRSRRRRPRPGNRARLPPARRREDRNPRRDPPQARAADDGVSGC